MVLTVRDRTAQRRTSEYRRQRERSILRRLREILEDLRAAADLSRLPEQNASAEQIDAALRVDLRPYDDRVRVAMLAPLRETFVAGANDAALALLDHGDSRVRKADGDGTGQGPSFTVLNVRDPEVERFLGSAGEHVVRRLKGETRVTSAMLENLRRQLIDLYATGEPVSLVAAQQASQRALRSSLVRALRVARTEVGRAHVAGEVAGMRRIDAPKEKRWITSGGPTVRSEHTDHAAEGWVPEDHVYGGVIAYPLADGAPASEVVNCRCSLGWRLASANRRARDLRRTDVGRLLAGRRAA